MTFGTICGEIDIPIVIHIQDVTAIPQCIVPVGMSPIDFIRHKGLGLRQRYVGLRSELFFVSRRKEKLNHSTL